MGGCSCSQHHQCLLDEVKRILPQIHWKTLHGIHNPCTKIKIELYRLLPSRIYTNLSLVIIIVLWYISVFWLLPKNQSFHRQIAGNGMCVGNHRVGWWSKGVMGQQNSCKTWNLELDTFDNASHAPQLRLCNYYLFTLCMTYHLSTKWASLMITPI